ncbi:MAG: response regulator [Muribaculaceae bacterium]|nr:response regulator [Muribaculaceae bacterium]
MTLKKLIVTAILTCLNAMPHAASQSLDFDAVPGSYNHLMTAIHHQDNGLIWVGTSTGLCRYDGYSITPAPTNLTDSATMLNDYILGISEDSKGRLWLKTEGGYGIYNPDTHTLQERISEIMPRSDISGKIIEIEPSPDNSMWIATDNGVFRLSADGTKADKVTGIPDNGLNITDIKLKDGAVVCVDESGSLIWIDPETMKATRRVSSPGSLDKNGKQNYILTVDSNDRYWVYHTFTIEVYDDNSKTWISDRIADKDRHSNTRLIYQDQSGTLWITRDNHGLERIETDSEGIHFTPADSPADLTYKNTITCLMEDNPGSLWIGTYKMGLMCHYDCIHKFSTEQLADVNCMLPTSDNWVWAGTDSSGLWKWNTSTGEKISYRDLEDGDSPAAITSLAEANGDLYIGSFSRGLRRVRDGRFEKVSTSTDLDNSYIWSLTTDKNGRIWASTLGGGVFRINPASGETVFMKNAENGLQSPFVVTGIASKDGRVYFGNAYGIAYHESSDGLIHNLKDLDPVFNTDGWRMTQLFEDSRGLIWAATSSGLKVIDRTHSKITKVKTGDGSFHNYVSGIIEDNGGSMWISEGRSLINLKISYDDKTGDLKVSPRSYNSRDGLIDCDFNQRSLAKLPSGEILAGGLYGVNRFSPTEMNFNTSRPQVVFTDLYIGDRLIHPGEKTDGHTVISTSLHDGGSIELPHGTPDFTIYFTTDNYALPEKTTYRYLLEGYNQEWRTVMPGQHSVTYTNLSPGRYRLLVKGINNDGYESTAPAELFIRVYPPFWASPWAIAVYVLLAALSVWGIIKIVTLLERKRYERKIEEENRAKQEEINQLKFKFFTNVSHDLRTPLTLIVSPLDEMIKEADDPRQRQRLTLMKVNATKLLTLVNQLLDFRKNEVAGLQLNASEGDVVAFSRNVCESFSGFTERKNVRMTFFSDHDSIRMLFDQDKLEKIFMNLIGNAFKFTQAGGSVDVSLEQVGNDNPVLRIKVADTGIGINDKDKEHIFERFYQVDDNGDSHPHMGSGIGLSLVSEYVKLHQGSIRVTDNVGKGSVFIIDIPIRRSTQDAEIVKKPIEEDYIPASAPKQAEERASASAAGASSAGALPLALVVDDNPDMTDMLKFELEADFDVLTASDGNEALGILENTTPAIILTDLMMPGMDGIELCRRLKSNPDTVSIPLIILTAKHDLGVKIEGLTLGADDYITKPFNLDVLRLRMKRLIELTAKGATRTLIEPEPEAIKITPLDEKFIEKAMKYVSDNLDSSRLSVEELSDHLGMSRVRLYKKIKQITGKTPIEFIRIIRLKRAAQLLRESQLNVSEIAYQTGFNNPKAFSKYFKEEFGILPSIYQDREGTETNYPV